MKRWLVWLGLVLVAGLVACGESQEVQQAPAVDGPALVMFYTDN